MFAWVCEMNCQDYLNQQPIDWEEERDTHPDTQPDCPPGEGYTLNRKKRSINLPQSNAVNLDYGSEEFLEDLLSNSREKRSSDSWAQCTFDEIEDHFTQRLYDCDGIDITDKPYTWYRPETPFHNKPGTAYHFADTLMTISEARDYCEHLHNNSFVWCPQSPDEQMYLYMAHPLQAFETHQTNGVSDPIQAIWTGFERHHKKDRWWCDTEYSTFNRVNPSTTLYENVYFDWGVGEQSTRGIPHIGIRTSDIKFASYRDYEVHAVICEMDCSIDKFVPNNGTFPNFDQEWDKNNPLGTTPPPTSIDIPAAQDEDPILEILDYLPNNITEQEIEQLKMHGCHCWKLGSLGKYVQNLGGHGQVDYLDDACSKWQNGRKCIELPGGKCFGEILDGEYYSLPFSNGEVSLDCSLNVGYDDCLLAACLIDVYWVNEIITQVELMRNGGSFTSTLGTVTECPFCEGLCAPPTSCYGEAPFVFLNH